GHRARPFDAVRDAPTTTRLTTVTERRPVPASFAPVLLALMTIVSGALAAQAERAPSPHTGATTSPLTTPVLSARRAPTILASPAAPNRPAGLRTDFPGRSPGPACLDVEADGASVFAQADADPFTPASLEKLLTGSVALDSLGRDPRLTTHVRSL